MENGDNIAQLIDQLSFLEYEIRRSITVREDQEEDALDSHLKLADQYGISLQGVFTKGDLLGAVQTAVRVARSRAAQDKSA